MEVKEVDRLEKNNTHRNDVKNYPYIFNSHAHQGIDFYGRYEGYYRFSTHPQG
jgi:hypothetical protein